MMYLHLKFKNAGLLYVPHSASGAASNHYLHDQRWFGDNFSDSTTYGHDFLNPLPYTLISNVLHCLCGEIPVPTKRLSIFERIPALDDIAKQSWFKFENDLICVDSGKDGESRIRPQYSDVFQTQKINPNSPQSANSIFYLHDGSFVTRNGLYSWSAFDKWFGETPDLSKAYIDLIQKYIKVNPRSLNFDNLILELSKWWYDADFINDVKDFILKTKKTVKSWNEVFFNMNIAKKPNGVIEVNRKPTSGNGSFQGKTPIVNKNGLCKITPMNGDIICPIEDEDIITKIKDGKGFARLLEGGFVYVNRIDFFEPFPNFKTYFTPVFSNQNQCKNIIYK